MLSSRASLSVSLLTDTARRRKEDDGRGRSADKMCHDAVKLPFPLTIRFKSMLQSGVMTRDLDVRWVSSLSWYFLNLFGLQSVFIFILGNDSGKLF